MYNKICKVRALFLTSLEKKSKQVIIIGATSILVISLSLLLGLTFRQPRTQTNPYVIK